MIFKIIGGNEYFEINKDTPEENLMKKYNN
jgi:hypothetical protein